MDISYAEKAMEFVFEQKFKGITLTEEQIREVMEQAKNGVSKENFTFTKTKKASWLKRLFKK
ncbi:hypothetical protein [Faecalibacter macacae]|uniref:Uncharacterized protein n=1 Tax=Faecalibacter macacae TaxID=1859289 RepID=A0A3L9M6Y9_9FLAO|nr:hypothetical protein [Faecalibacter macacae]RLZ08582.1 hypothetical protein EAH69_09720 [Faecalibacter macacae]